MLPERAEVLQRKLAFAAQDHPTQVAAPTQQPRQVSRRKTLLPKEVFQHVQAGHVRPSNILQIVILDQRAKQVKVVGLINRSVVQS
jgi:hypothetical protein